MDVRLICRKMIINFFVIYVLQELPVKPSVTIENAESQMSTFIKFYKVCVISVFQILVHDKLFHP